MAKVSNVASTLKGQMLLALVLLTAVQKVVPSEVSLPGLVPLEPHPAAPAAPHMCDQDCPTLYQPVCGSNGLTYNNECEFGVAQCHNSSLIIMFEEECQISRFLCCCCDDDDSGSDDDDDNSQDCLWLLLLLCLLPCCCKRCCQQQCCCCCPCNCCCC